MNAVVLLWWRSWFWRMRCDLRTTGGAFLLPPVYALVDACSFMKRSFSSRAVIAWLSPGGSLSNVAVLWAEVFVFCLRLRPSPCLALPKALRISRDKASSALHRETSSLTSMSFLREMRLSMYEMIYFAHFSTYSNAHGLSRKATTTLCSLTIFRMHFNDRTTRFHSGSVLMFS